jgi:hypothetical protein
MLDQKFFGPRWYPLIPHPEQLRMEASKARFTVNPAGRRSGKTERKKRKLVIHALDPRRWSYPNPIYAAAAPTRDQAKRIWWNDLKALSPRPFVRQILEVPMEIHYITGSVIRVVGMDKPERIEGSPLDGIVMDEYANMKSEAWEANVLPALTDRLGWADLIGVPEGRNHYYDLWKMARGKWNVSNGGDWDGFTWHSADIVEKLHPGEIDRMKEIMDPLTFQQEYMADFINFAGQAYYPFHEDIHVARLRQNYNPKAPLIVCFDFNVDPGVCVIAQEMELPSRQQHVHGIEIGGHKIFGGVLMSKPTAGTGCIGEVYIPRNSNTPAVVRKLIEDWGDHEGHVLAYGDATGGARSTTNEDGSSNWDLIKTALYEHYGPQRVSIRLNESDAGRPMNPPERSRVNAVNSRLMTDDGTVRFMVDGAECPMLVKDFEGTRLLEGGSGEIDKKSDLLLTHLTDAVGYYVAKEFPVRREVASITELSR